MCGIAGFAGSNPEVIEKMTSCLVHRGPDGNAIWRGENASLGHARLAILDPRPEGDQPMWNDSKTIAIVFNGEIYNYRELRDLEKLECRTNTDTEVVLKMFEKYGIGFVDRLRGMFAFGIYDTVSGTWFVVRDHKGIKPLFVAYPEGRLAFASEMRSLMKAMPVKPVLNMKALSMYMRLQYVPGPQTLCEGIEQVPPGTIIRWRNGEETRSTFKPMETAVMNSKNDFRTKFPEIMDGIVKQHLISDKPVGLFLSGGIDSSILLHHMSKQVKEPVKTFTVRFDATEAEDGKRFNTDADLAKMTAAHYGTNHHEVFLSADDFRNLYRETTKALDQPNANAVSVAQFLLAREAKKHVDVALSGVGGDELFGGYPRYRITRILNSLSIIPSGLRTALGKLTSNPSDVLGMNPGPELAERLLARPTDEVQSIVRGNWYQADAVTGLFAQRFNALGKTESVRDFMEFDRHLWLVDEALRLADATTMGSGLEGRVPFVDERIIAASHATPSSWHVTMRQTKALLKETYRPLLPEHLFTLPKASFFPPVAKWLRREAAPLTEEMITHPRIREFFDETRIREMIEGHNTREKYAMHIISSLIQLSHWFDEVYDSL